MNGRERLIASLTGQVPDRIAWAPLIDGYFLASLPAGFLRERLGLSKAALAALADPLIQAERIGRRLVDLKRLIGADVLQRHAPGLTSRVDDLKVEWLSQGDRVLRRHVTSAGILTDVVYSVPESPNYPFFGVEYKLKSAADLRVYRHIWANTHFAPDYQAFVSEDAYIADDGVAAIDGPQSAVQLLLGEEAGLTNFYYLLRDHQDDMEALIQTMHARIREAYVLIARSPARIVIAMEDLSGTTSSPEIFQRYSWRHLNEYADILHAEGKVFLAHMCGRLKAMAPLIARSRLDGVESLTPPAIGDLKVAEAREAWGQDFVLVGGLDANVMLETSAGAVRAAVIDALEQAAPGLNFVLSNADAMPYGASLATLQLVAQVVAEHGAFPLSGATLQA